MRPVREKNGDELTASSLAFTAMRKNLLCPAVALTFTLISGVASADTFHVAPAGVDTAPGTATAPWQTIQRAADAVTAGDTVVIHAGTYAGFRVGARGTETAPISFVGDGDACITGSVTADRDVVHVESNAWIRIEGLHVSGATRAGISALDCDHITVRGNRVDANGRWGVFSSFCDDLLVEDNEITSSAGLSDAPWGIKLAAKPCSTRTCVTRKLMSNTRSITPVSMLHQRTMRSQKAGHAPCCSMRARCTRQSFWSARISGSPSALGSGGASIGRQW